MPDTNSDQAFARILEEVESGPLKSREGRCAPWTLVALECLDDGDWHSYHEVVSKAMSLVPEHTAVRKAEINRIAARGGPDAKQNMERLRGSAVKTGQRMVVAKAIRGLLKSGRVELRYENESAQRRRPASIRRKHA